MPAPLSDTTVIQLRRRTIDVCKECDHTGSFFDPKVKEFKDCTCVRTFRWYRLLTQANVPERFWTWDLRYLTQEFKENNRKELKAVLTYYDHLLENIEGGNGLYFFGPSGVAKSAFASYIVKGALQADIPSYVIRMSKLTELAFEALKVPEKHILLEFLTREVKLVVVEEIEKDFKIKDDSSFSGARVGQIFGDWYDRKVALLVTSNVPKIALRRVHAESVVDRLAELVDVPFTGKSFRSKTGAEEQLLTQAHETPDTDGLEGQPPVGKPKRVGKREV